MNPTAIPTDLHGLLLFAIDTLRVRGVHYQLAALLIVLGVAFLLWRTGASSGVAVAAFFSRISRHSVLSAALVFVTAFALFSLPTLLSGRSISPLSADEFGYLLTADTFRHGQLTNPPHPLWKHFENFYILQQPTYNSKYFPAQALAIAAGWIVLGHPTDGVRLSGALACVAILWMLRGWFSKPWALLGSLIAVTSFVVFDWNQTYLGGNVALLGGALCLGALARITTRELRIRDPIVLGVGISILANSRPFEGLVFSLCLGAFLWHWLLTKGRAQLGVVGVGKRVVLPLALVMGLNLSWIATYDHAVTGDALTLPYALYLKQYEATPIGLFRQPNIPSIVTACTMRNYNEAFVEQYRTFHTFKGFAIVETHRIGTVVLTLISIACLPFFVVGLYRSLHQRQPFIPLLILTCIAGSSLTYGFLPQYLAHVAAAMLIVTVQGIRSVYQSNGKRGFLRLVAVLTPVSQLLALLLFIGKQEIAASIGKGPREDIENDLRARAGDHLVVVRESCSANNWAFVYNEANIDASRIVWARELTPAENQTLLRYFANRHPWLLEVEGGKARIRPLSRDVPEMK